MEKNGKINRVSMMHKFVKDIKYVGDYVQEKTCNVMLCGDSKYIEYCGLTIISVLKSNMNTDFCFHILCDNISNDDLERLAYVSQKYKINIRLYILNEDIINSMIASVIPERHISVATFFRILGFEILDESYERVLYLDADIMVRGSISAFFDLNLQGKVIGGISDVLECEHLQRIIRSKYINDESIDNNRYFNAGVIVVNLKKWKEGNYTKKCLDNIYKYKYEFMDQDALNITLRDDAVFLDSRYNYQYDLSTIIAKGSKNEFLSKPYVYVINDISVVHFVGRVKPWFKCALWNPFAQEYRKMQQDSPWNTTKLLDLDDFQRYEDKYKFAKLDMKAAWKTERYIDALFGLYQYSYYKVQHIINR